MDKHDIESVKQVLYSTYSSRNQRVLVVDLGFTTVLTSQAISVAFYSEREKSD